MRAFSYYFLLFSTLIWFQNCGNRNIDLKQYYFPLKQLKDAPKVYEYVFSTQDTSFKIYWYYQTKVVGDSVNFIGTAYNGNFEVMLLFNEEQVNNGMRLKSLSYFGVNKDGKSIESKARIEGGSVYPFEAKDDKSVFINIITYADPKDSLHTTTLTRNRRFLKESSYDFKGKPYASVEFEMKEEQADKDPVKGGWSKVFKIDETYLRGVGLVYSKRDLGNGLFIESRLNDIISMAELEQRFKVYQQGNGHEYH
jgi:hypothetical protein